MRVVPGLLLAIVFTAACSSPTSPSLEAPITLPGGATTTTLTRGSLNATVDGVRWDATSPLGTITANAALPGSDRLTVSGQAVSSGLFITLSAPLATGTYDLASTSSFVTFGVLQGLGSIWSAAPSPSASGTLTLTTASPSRVAGTFSFVATALSAGTTPPTRTVTNGAFDLSR